MKMLRDFLLAEKIFLYRPDGALKAQSFMLLLIFRADGTLYGCILLR